MNIYPVTILATVSSPAEMIAAVKRAIADRAGLAEHGYQPEEHIAAVDPRYRCPHHPGVAIVPRKIRDFSTPRGMRPYFQCPACSLTDSGRTEFNWHRVEVQP